MGAATRRRVVVHGFVQGVGFRLATLRTAKRHRLSGWVRNRPDGAVEAVFEGAADEVEAMIRWCRRGPRGADVAGVQVFDEPPEGLDGFGLRG